MVETKTFTATRNACKLCSPLGACFVFKGIEGTVPFLHGSQGCSTYVRRYMISHFKEPIDIASSNFSESTSIFGGGENFRQGILNVCKQYRPGVIGIATTCLSETIGDDVPAFIRQSQKDLAAENLPTLLIHVSTPSYRGTHMNGFYSAIYAVVSQIAQKLELESSKRYINVLSSLISPADIRHLKEIFTDFGVKINFLPDYSDTLDGPNWSTYYKIPREGTPISGIVGMGSAKATVEFGRTIQDQESAGLYLDSEFQVPLYRLGLPIGIQETDRFFKVLGELTGKQTPKKHKMERGRLVDAYVDGHKYLFGKRAVVYGEEDLIVGLTAFLSEIGIQPVLVASGGKSGILEKTIRQVVPKLSRTTLVKEGVDFSEIEETISELSPDLIIGNSKGFSMSKRLNIPLIRVGFPIHDRMGGQRILHVGYRGTQHLFDRVVNAIIEQNQAASPVGYSYM